MGLIQAFTGAVSGTFADQWKDIITAGVFDERTAVTPGVFRQQNNGRGSNYHGSDGVISNGSKIFVPENTAAFVFGQAGIEEMVTTPGGYEYRMGQDSVFAGDGIAKSIIDQAVGRFGFGGQTQDQKIVAFVNLRELRGIKFGTKAPLIYNDLFYGTDLSVTAFGSFSLKIIDSIKFVRNFMPAMTTFYSFDNPQARAQIRSEFLQSFIDALNTLSTKYRISQLPSQANELSQSITEDTQGAGTWNERFGFTVVGVGIENIALTPESAELVKMFSSNKMKLKAYEDVSQQSSNIAAQQKVAQGVQNHGLGDGGGMLFGMNLASALNPHNAGPAGIAAPLRGNMAPNMIDAGTVVCKKCGAENSEKTKFCTECGERLAKICEKCGAVITGSPKFCPECGASAVKKCAGCGAVITDNPKFCPECGNKTGE